MTITKILETIKNQFLSNWFVCRITSGRKSAQYGIRFSYPLYISLVALGIFLVNPYLLAITALIAFFGIILPMHPFDYIYNFGITKLFKTAKIPGRGSELQINSLVALLLNITVIALIIYEFKLSYEIMALIYILSSTFFITIQLSTDNFSLNSIFKRDK